MPTQPVIDHRGDSAHVTVVDDYPRRVPARHLVAGAEHSHAVIVSEAVVAAISAALDLLAVTLFGKPWSELFGSPQWSEWFA